MIPLAGAVLGSILGAVDIAIERHTSLHTFRHSSPSTATTVLATTDVMPLTHRGKYTMLVQSTVSLALFALIVARAVNAST